MRQAAGCGRAAVLPLHLPGLRCGHPPWVGAGSLPRGACDAATLRQTRRPAPRAPSGTALPRSYDKRVKQEKERALNAARVNAYRKLQKKLGDRLAPAQPPPEVGPWRAVGLPPARARPACRASLS